jgi:cytochrome oxidase Cu insertion factor (SCO1/SenC/PrrC family)
MTTRRNSGFAPDENSDIVMRGTKMFAEVKIMKRMSSILPALVVGTVLVAGSLSFAQQQPAAQQQNRTIPHTNLKVGDMAPDFTLPDSNFKQVKLSDFRGKKNVILAFYVLAFTGG